jgi:5'-methylthioinosine phosphorylase
MAISGMQYAIIAGSGFRSFGSDSEGVIVSTSFGNPSGPIRELRYDDHTVYFLPRHGDNLRIPPHAINYRANMKALQQLDTDCVIAMNTVGVIKSEIYPGQIVTPHQLIDYTWGRAHSVYDGDGELDHIDLTNPFSEHLRQELLEAARTADVPIHDGGVYAVTQGPRLETAAEVDRLERDGAGYVGMTAMPEAALARELGMDYACLSLVVNHAAGRGEKSIHADIEASTMTAKMQAMKVLRVFFGVSEE